jgi:hypothetical protein
MKERLGGDAADIEAGAAERGAPFHERDLETELRGSEGANITAGTGTNNGNVK